MRSEVVAAIAAVCAAAGCRPHRPAPALGVPNFSHVWLIVMENAGFDDVVGAPAAPFLYGEIIPRGALLTNYHAVAHPSLPNYLALVGGDTFGILSDGEATDPSHQVGLGHSNLGVELSAAGLPWHAFAEGMARPCQASSAGRYAARHNPFPYFQDQRGASACVDHDRPFGELAQGSNDRFTLLIPDLCDDGHDPCGGDPAAHIDAWLARNLPPLFASEGYRKGGAIFITWDEDDGQSADNRVPMIIASPLVRSGGVQSAARRDHYGWLATVEASLGLPRLAKAAAAEPIDDIWR